MQIHKSTMYEGCLISSRPKVQADVLYSCKLTRLQIYFILPFPIRRATSVPLGKGTKFALHHGKMSTTKRRAIQILHIARFSLLLNVDITILYPNTQTLTGYM